MKDTDKVSVGATLTEVGGGAGGGHLGVLVGPPRLLSIDAVDDNDDNEENEKSGSDGRRNDGSPAGSDLCHQNGIKFLYLMLSYSTYFFYPVYAPFS